MIATSTRTSVRSINQQFETEVITPMENQERNNIDTWQMKNGVHIDEVDILDAVANETEALEKELADERDARLRLAAEYDNFRRRVRGVRTESADEGKRYVLMQMLSIADDLDRAAEHADQDPDAVAEGLNAIRSRITQMLQVNEVRKFESEGETFDPEYHEAFDVIESGVGKEGTVHKEVRAGYLMRDKLLRPSLVVVNK